MPRDNIIRIDYILYGHESSLSDLEDKLQTDINNGLDKEEAARRLPGYGLNKLSAKKPSFWKLYLAPLFDALITIYLLMTGIMLILAIFVPGVYAKISFWIVMVTFNIILAIYQQFRAQKKIEALLQMSPPRAKVIRKGQRSEILAEELVPGDIIELAIGDKIPADARIIRSSNLTINEASLTGESAAVEKITDGNEIVNVGTPISQHRNFLYLGTYVQTGSAEALVVRTGNNTELGKIAEAMSEMHTLDIPLRRKVNTLGKILATLMVLFLFARVIFSIRIRMAADELTPSNFLFDLADSILVAMSVIPINIPLLTTIVLISGVLNMAKKKVIVKNLAIIETLGRCSVLCSDKTGTLTTSKMSVKLIWDTQQYWGTTFRGLEYTVTDVDNVTEFMETEALSHPPLINVPEGSTLELNLTGAILNNDAILQFKTDSKTHADYDVIGDSTDAALLVLGLTQGYHDEKMKERYIRFKDFPFDSSLKRMTSLFRDEKENDYMIFSKGASEVILPRCDYIGDEKTRRKLDDKEREEILTIVNNFAEDGYRVISLAYHPLDSLPKVANKRKEREQYESGLTYIGFTVIYDPPRPGAKQAVADLDSAGIFPIMITGDSIKTAATIARQVGILDPDEMVAEGRLASTLTDDVFFKVSVFARVSPQDKEVIVSRYQRKGEIVTMTGDGVNDALAITRSDAGVSMGQTGTEVTKEASDLIIVDDSYVSLVNGVQEGRNLFEKIRIMIFFYLTLNFAEALMYFTASFIPGFQLISSWQRIYIFTIIHAFPVFAIIFGPGDKQIMKLKPRANDAIIPKQLFLALLVFAVSYLISLLSVYFLYYNGIFGVSEYNLGGITSFIEFGGILDNPTDLAQVKARTMLITVMYLSESFIVLSIRRINTNLYQGAKDTNLFVWLMILVGPIFHLFVLYNNSLQLKLKDIGITIDFMPLNILDIMVAIFFASIPIVILEVFKRNRRNRNIQF
jgi:Ca2+-transporting ATPase